MNMDDFFMCANIEAIRKSGKVNMFDIGTVHKLYNKYFPWAISFEEDVLNNLLMNGLPEEVEKDKLFIKCVNRGLEFINNDTPDILDSIDERNVDASIEELAQRYGLKTSQKMTLKKVYIAWKRE